MTKVWNSIRALAHHLKERKQKENIKIGSIVGGYVCPRISDINYFDDVKTKCDVLVVLVYNDYFFKKNYGNLLVSCEERCATIAKLASVDYVASCLDYEDINILQPDVTFNNA